MPWTVLFLLVVLVVITASLIAEIRVVWPDRTGTKHALYSKSRPYVFGQSMLDAQVRTTAPLLSACITMIPLFVFPLVKNAQGVFREWVAAILIVDLGMIVVNGVLLVSLWIFEWPQFFDSSRLSEGVHAGHPRIDRSLYA